MYARQLLTVVPVNWFASWCHGDNSKMRQDRAIPVSILYKSIAGRYRPVRVADGPITARCRFIKNAIRDGS